ncbi:MAG: hypothetical protein PHF93_10950 [Acidobacteriota bacterium]|nr:hypothetical protein [Acidobacteriota bacterium]MDD8030268.1 hypothetical protein [Acidobacteriota bacterium]MDD8034323.1 hypothetical protein [Acidobacteriota bacterium]MDW3227557.1 hypothetical protein [Acidobacteriota bacterium]
MRKITTAAVIALAASAVAAAGAEDLKESLAPKLQRIIEFQAEVGSLHPVLQKLHPVAVVDGDRFLIFDLDESKTGYRFLKEAPVPMPMPQGVRAAFPLEALDNRSACVVSPEVFDSVRGYVTIFHEFVHCRQWETVEPVLKERLSIYRRAVEAGDYMWELNYPFPYQNAEFAEDYPAALDRMDRGDGSEALRIRARLRDLLGPENYEYLCWQEWKEGFARYLENAMLRHLDMEENHGGLALPLTRVAFYEGGSRFISFLEGRENGLTLNLETLFERIADPSGEAAGNSIRPTGPSPTTH